MSSSSSSSSAKPEGAGGAGSGSGSSSSSAASAPGSPGGSSLFSDSENEVQKKAPQSSAASAQPSSASTQPSAAAARTAGAAAGAARAQPGAAAGARPSAQPSGASVEQTGKRRKPPEAPQEKPEAKRKKPQRAKSSAPTARQDGGAGEPFVLNLEALQGSWRHSSPNLGSFVVSGDTARFANGVSFRVVARADGQLEMVGWLASREQSTAEEIVWSKNGVVCSWYFEDDAENLEGDGGINTRNIINGKRRRAKVDYKQLARQLKEEERRKGLGGLDDGSDESDDLAEAKEAPLSPAEQAKLNAKHVAEVVQKFRQWMLSTRSPRHEELLQRRGRLSTTVPIQVAPSGQALLAKALRGYGVQIAHRGQGAVLSVDAAARRLFQERHPDLWAAAAPAAAAAPEGRAPTRPSVAAAAADPAADAAAPAAGAPAAATRRRRLRRAVTASDGSGDEAAPPQGKQEVPAPAVQTAPAPETPKLPDAPEEQPVPSEQAPEPSAAAEPEPAPVVAPAAPMEVDNEPDHEAEQASEEAKNDGASHGDEDAAEATGEGCSVDAAAPEAPPASDPVGADKPEQPARSIAEVRALLEARPPAEEVQALLDFLAEQPVDASVLTQTKIGLTVNKLKQDYQDAKLKATATELVARWRQLWQKQQQQLQA